MGVPKSQLLYGTVRPAYFFLENCMLTFLSPHRISPTRL